MQAITVFFCFLFGMQKIDMSQQDFKSEYIGSNRDCHFWSKRWLTRVRWFCQQSTRYYRKLNRPAIQQNMFNMLMTELTMWKIINLMLEDYVQKRLLTVNRRGLGDWLCARSESGAAVVYFCACAVLLLTLLQVVCEHEKRCCCCIFLYQSSPEHWRMLVSLAVLRVHAPSKVSNHRDQVLNL